MNSFNFITKQYRFANQWFTLPFRVAGFWVEDSRGRNVAEVPSPELAKALAEMLNKAAASNN